MLRVWVLQRCKHVLMLNALRAIRSRSSVWSLKMTEEPKASTSEPPTSHSSITSYAKVPPVAKPSSTAATAARAMRPTKQPSKETPPPPPWHSVKQPTHSNSVKVAVDATPTTAQMSEPSPEAKAGPVDAGTLIQHHVEDRGLFDEHEEDLALRDPNTSATQKGQSPDDDFLYESMKQSMQGASAMSQSSALSESQIVTLIASLIPKFGKMRIAELSRLVPPDISSKIARKEDIAAMLQQHSPNTFIVTAEEISRAAAKPPPEIPYISREKVEVRSSSQMEDPKPDMQQPIHTIVPTSFSDSELMDLVVKSLPASHRPVLLSTLMRSLAAEVQAQITQKKYGLAHFLVKHGGSVVTVQNDAVMLSQSPSSCDDSSPPSAPSVAPNPPNEDAHQTSSNTVVSTKNTASSTATRSASSSHQSKLAPPPLPSFLKKPQPLGAAPSLNRAATNPSFVQRFRTPHEILEIMIEYIPTFWVDVQQVQASLSDEAKQLFEGKQKFSSFLRKYRFYFDVQQTHRGLEVKLRDEVQSGKRGTADTKYAQTALSLDISLNIQPPEVQQQQQRPGKAVTKTVQALPRGVPLVAHIWKVCPTEFIRLDELERRIPPIVFSDPTFDTVAGLRGLLDKRFDIFQIVEGKVRRRPANVAPNAIDEKWLKTSPSPDVFSVLLSHVPQDGTSFVDTAELFALLSAEERDEIKTKFLSFPRFLRMHGGEVHVTQDNLKVRRFLPKAEPPPTFDAELEAAAASVAADAGTEQSGASDFTDPINTEGAEDLDVTPTDFPHALRELYDALPLMQAAELEDVVFMLSPSIRLMLPSSTSELAAELEKHPEYFAVWQFPDDTSVVVVQRARLQTLDVTEDDIVRQLHPLIPQGGIDADRLLRKSPLALQRFLYKNGIRKTLEKIRRYFIVSENRIMKVV